MRRGEAAAVSMEVSGRGLQGFLVFCSPELAA